MKLLLFPDRGTGIGGVELLPEGWVDILII
jgi:hypothetical protein